MGQTVNIRLSNFPDREFGMLVGKINNISLTPDRDGNLLIDVELPNNLMTTYKKTIPFQQEMQGTAGIVTEDLRLIERLLYQFREVFNKWVFWQTIIKIQYNYSNTPDGNENLFGLLFLQIKKLK